MIGTVIFNMWYMIYVSFLAPVLDVFEEADLVFGLR